MLGKNECASQGKNYKVERKEEKNASKNGQNAYGSIYVGYELQFFCVRNDIMILFTTDIAIPKEQELQYSITCLILKFI